LKSLSGSGNDGGDGDNKGVIDAIEIMIENLRKECYAKFAEREDAEDMKKRIGKLEN
jgi:hypothetical protein